MIQSLLHIIISLLLLVGSTGVVMNKHFCQNELKNYALYAKAENCHSKQKKQSHCEKHPVTETTKCNAEKEKNCCNSESEYIKSDQDLIQIQLDEFNGVELISFAAIISVFILGPEAGDNYTNPPYLNYKPPLLLRDILTAKQSFLC